MGIRKNARALTPAERDAFLRAALTLKNTIANPGDPPAQQINVFDQFVAIHLAVLAVRSPGSGGLPVNTGHQGAGFGPWHREYLRRFELALQSVDPTVNLPYWDWSDHSATELILLQDAFLGPNGGAGGVGGGTVASGYLAFDAPGSGSNPTPLPPWWPAGLAGWRVRPSLQQGWGAALRRNRQAFANLTTKGEVLTTLGTSTGATPDAKYNTFRSQLEAGFHMHNFLHGWVGGQMGDPNASPNDLIFFLHHCNIDRLWAMWQVDGHEGAAYYPATGQSYGHNLNDPMWPWVGAAAGFSSDNLPSDVVLPSFAAQPQRRPVDTIDHRAMGYAYDTEVVLGVALDQTGSMTGQTPDPMTGGPATISKWDAAKQGVSFLLQDCESAYDQGEAYVTAGVETFRSLATNVFTPVFSGTPSGLIRSGTPYSRAQFDTLIALQSPGGGTPLAGALSHTETSLVRAPFGGNPPNDPRYLFMLTDGIETAPPPLSSLGTPAFPDTLIFGMGFGVGSGWNGVDYATIASLVAKGRAAPPGVATQVFHGENAGVIDKFFTSSIAAAIGYVPVVDPIYELFPGEHADTGFDVTSADESFLITCLGFDYDDESWDFCVVAPDGHHCGDETPGHHHQHEDEEWVPYGFSMVKRNGRATIFLRRDGAPEDAWVGRWYVRAMYRVSEEMLMWMPSVWDLTLPAGSPPVRGPLYARLLQSPKRRLPVRLVPPPAPRPESSVVQGLADASDPRAACAVAVNVYGRPSLHVELALQARQPYAGQDLDAVLSVEDRAGGQIRDLSVIGRLVAPAFSLGNALADASTIPPKARRRYVNRENVNAPFDTLRYLADYERQRPGAFPVRDEVLDFTRRAGTMRAKLRGNDFPGIYRVGVRLEGTVVYPGHDPQRFSRVVSAAAALGIRPDRAQSKATLDWVAPDRFVVTATLVDRLGNVALPTAQPLRVAVNGTPVRAEGEPGTTAEQRAAVRVGGRFELSDDRRRVTRGRAELETLDGRTLRVQKGERLAVEIGAGGPRVPVGVA